MRAGKAKADISSDGSMTLGGHLSEFRNRIIVCLAVFIVAFLICMTQARGFSELLISRATMFKFIYTAPTELFLVYMRLALIGALIIDGPVIIYEVWSFMKPGLKETEKRAIRMTFGFGIVLFVIGILFAFFMILPISTQFFYSLNRGELIQPMISIESYVNYVTQILLAFGVVFELPIVVVMLTSIGVLRSSFLKRNRKFVIVLVFLVAAIITPPDVTSQVLVAVPMLVLFEGSVFLSSLIERGKLKKNKEKETEADEEEGAEGTETEEEGTEEKETEEAGTKEEDS